MHGSAQLQLNWLCSAQLPRIGACMVPRIATSWPISPQRPRVPLSSKAERHNHAAAASPQACGGCRGGARTRRRAARGGAPTLARLVQRAREPPQMRRSARKLPHALIRISKLAQNGRGAGLPTATGGATCTASTCRAPHAIEPRRPGRAASGTPATWHADVAGRRSHSAATTPLSARHGGRRAVTPCCARWRRTAPPPARRRRAPWSSLAPSTSRSQQQTQTPPQTSSRAKYKAPGGQSSVAHGAQPPRGAVRRRPGTTFLWLWCGEYRQNSFSEACGLVARVSLASWWRQNLAHVVGRQGFRTRRTPHGDIAPEAPAITTEQGELPVRSFSGIVSFL